MKIRAKFQVESVSRTYWGAFMVKLSARYDESIPEDQKFSEATPSASVEMHVENPKAQEEFALGRIFYVDFTPADETKKGEVG